MTTAYHSQLFAHELTRRRAADEDDKLAGTLIVADTARLLVERTISIPRILVVPEGEVRVEFQPFTLDLSRVSYQRPSHDLVIQHLSDNRQERMQVGGGTTLQERRPQDRVVSGLLLHPEISYDENADTLYHLADQVVAHLEAQGHDEAAIHDILRVYERPLSSLIFTQMRRHQTTPAVRYVQEVRQGFTELRSGAFTASTRGGLIANSQQRPPTGTRIEACVYTGFTRSLYRHAKFDSDAERLLAVVLEQGSEKWFRPVRGQFQMHYRWQHHLREYQPDFVAETGDAVLMLKVKARNELDDPEVLEKARVATEWCQAATAHAARYGGRPWAYHLIPHDIIGVHSTLEGLTGAVLAH